MTGAAFAILLGFGLILNKAAGTIRLIFRARSRLNAETTGRLSRPAPAACARQGIPRRGARGQGFRRRRTAPAGQCPKDVDGDFGDEPVVHGAVRFCERAHYLPRCAPYARRHHDHRHLRDLRTLPRLLVAPIYQIGHHRNLPRKAWRASSAPAISWTRSARTMIRRRTLTIGTRGK